MRRALLVVLAVVALVCGGTYAWSAVVNPTASCTSAPPVTQTSTGGKIVITCTVPNKVTSTATATATVTKTVTASPSPTSPTTVPTTAPTSPTTSPAGTWACVKPLGGGCGPYSHIDSMPMSNGFDTYISNQNLNTRSGETETVYANSPSDWQVVANLDDCGGCVQTYPDVQQLTNDWGGTRWNGNDNTPLAALSALNIHYDETSPASGASYEFSPDIWESNYNNDVMFWVDTVGRCNTGAFGSTVLGHTTIDGQGWTVHRYGGAGAEIIFVLDGPGGPGTCAQQHSGVINIKAGMEWLVSQGFVTGPVVLTQVNSGWEITQSSGATFTMNDYSIEAPVAP